MAKAKDTSPQPAPSSGFVDLKLYSRDDFAKSLGIEAETMWKFFHKHKIPTRTVCRRRMFLMSDFLRCVPIDESETHEE